MRMLRWAAEMATSEGGEGRILGAAALEALLGSELLQPEDTDMVMSFAHLARSDPAGYTEDDHLEGDESHG